MCDHAFMLRGTVYPVKRQRSRLTLDVPASCSTHRGSEIEQQAGSSCACSRAGPSQPRRQPNVRRAFGAHGFPHLRGSIQRRSAGAGAQSAPLLQNWGRLYGLRSALAGLRRRPARGPFSPRTFASMLARKARACFGGSRCRGSTVHLARKGPKDAKMLRLTRRQRLMRAGRRGCAAPGGRPLRLPRLFLRMRSSGPRRRPEPPRR